MDVQGDLAAVVERAVAAVLDELALDPEERRYDLLLEGGGELRGSMAALVRSTRRSKMPLEAATACRRALPQVRRVLAAAAGNELALGALDLELDTADLLGLVARFDVADRLAGVVVREVGRETGVAAGYISELRQAKKGLPSLETARRLDKYLAGRPGEARSAGPSVADVADRARADTEDLKASRRRRRGVTAPDGRRIPAGLREEDRLRAVADELRRDPALLQTVERILVLGDRERRAVAQLIEALTGR
jgi:hypothetical protein